MFGCSTWEILDLDGWNEMFSPREWISTTAHCLFGFLFCSKAQKSILRVFIHPPLTVCRNPQHYFGHSKCPIRKNPHKMFPHFRYSVLFLSLPNILWCPGKLPLWRNSIKYLNIFSKGSCTVSGLSTELCITLLNLPNIIIFFTCQIITLNLDSVFIDNIVKKIINKRVDFPSRCGFWIPQKWLRDIFFIYIQVQLQ